MNIKRNIDWSRDANRLAEVQRVSKLPLTNADRLLLTDYLLKAYEKDADFWTFHDLPPIDSQRYADVQDFSLMEPYFAKAPTRVSQTSKLSRSEVMERLKASASKDVSGSTPKDDKSAERRGEGVPDAEAWLQLWRSIDRTEYLIQKNADLKGERKSPIRPQLFKRLEWGLLENEAYADLLTQLDKEAASLDEIRLKKLKLDLVRLRRQQYLLLDDLKDEQVKLIRTGKPQAYHEQEANVALYPVDTSGSTPFPFRFYSSAEIDALQGRAKCLLKIDKEGTLVDLTDAEVLRSLITNYGDLEGYAETNSLIATIVHYIDLYADECRFAPHISLIYEGRKENLMPEQIQADIIQLISKKYAPNYLYTMFTNQVLKPLAEKALEHLEILRAVARGSQEFKRCSKCGEYKVRSTTNFAVRSSSKDGFLGTCKECRAKDRAKKAEKVGKED